MGTVESIIEQVNGMNVDERRQIILGIKNSIEEDEKSSPIIVRYSFLVNVAEAAIGHKMDADRKKAGDVMVRMFVAYRMHTEGFSYTDIGMVMGHNHSTVIHYVRQMQDCFDEPIFYANDLNLYVSFNEAVEEADNDG